VYYTVIKLAGHLRTRGKCRKHKPQASVFYISRVFSNVRSVGAINHAGCWENTRKACKSRAVRRAIYRLFEWKSGLSLLWNNYGKSLSMRRKFIVLSWSSCLFSSNSWDDATDQLQRLKEWKHRLRAGQQSDENVSLQERCKKGKEKVIGEGQK